MKIWVSRFLTHAVFLTVVAISGGCGGGDSGNALTAGGTAFRNGGATTNTITFANGASVNATPSGNGGYVINGNQLAGVAALDISISYDTSLASSPSVTQDTLFAGRAFVANTAIPGKIRIALVGTTGVSGSGPIAAISFGTASRTEFLSLDAVTMLDASGHAIQ